MAITCATPQWKCGVLPRDGILLGGDNVARGPYRAQHRGVMAPASAAPRGDGPRPCGTAA